MMDLTPRYQVGDRYLDFTVKAATAIDELQLVLYEFIHNPTGAEVIHLANDDKENLFCLSFRTLPTDSTGVAHILEHTVLCGSKKFPVKDPFFSMIRRSLNTFMNAMTGQDTTFYPAASQVEADFYNLLDVYLDAVFFPKLDRLSFLQEGHRLEFATPGDPHSPLVFKGIVFNEMKGSLSNPESRLWHAILGALTPDLTYAFNSGGDPAEIPNLTYEGLKAFHQTHYHPSRCLFFFYGNLSSEKHLSFIEERVLKKSEKKEPLAPIKKQPRFDRPHSRVAFYPFEGESKKNTTFLTYSWLTLPVEKQEEVLALTLLDSMLMETDASPLKRALLGSKLCTQVDSYLDTEMSEVPYSIVCKGCESADQKEVQELLFATLRACANEGFSPAIIDAALHQLSFSRLEITRDHGPFGLTLFGRAGFAKQHGCSVQQALSTEQMLSNLKEKGRDPTYFSALLTKYFLTNPHFVALALVPDHSLADEEKKRERERLGAVQKDLSARARQTILDDTLALQKYQQKTERQSLDCLPCITLAEVPKEPPHFPLRREQANPFTLFHHNVFTNHIIYADLTFDLPQIAWEDLPYLQLFTTLISELGIGGRTYQDTLNYINAHLGDFSAEIHLHPAALDGEKLSPSFSLRGKALLGKQDKLFALFRDSCHKIDLSDKERLHQLILQLHTAQQTKINKHALHYAAHLAVSGFSTVGAIGQAWGGLPYFHFIQDLATHFPARFPLLVEKFETLFALLFHGHQPQLILSCADEDKEVMKKAHFYGLGDVPTSPSLTPWPASLSHSLHHPESQGRIIASPVAFSALGFSVHKGFHSHTAPLMLASYLFENTLLHAQIREQGGAYGAGAHYRPAPGHLYFYAYRDPHIAATLATFRKSIDAVAEGNFTERDLDEAKLNLIQDSDTPISPGNRAWVTYCREREGKTLALRQSFRQAVLTTDKESLCAAVRTHLSGQKDKGVAVAFADEALLSSELPTWPLYPI